MECSLCFLKVLIEIVRLSVYFYAFFMLWIIFSFVRVASNPNPPPPRDLDSPIGAKIILTLFLFLGVFLLLVTENYLNDDLSWQRITGSSIGILLLSGCVIDTTCRMIKTARIRLQRGGK
jgi:hypothetical protein